MVTRNVPARNGILIQGMNRYGGRAARFLAPANDNGPTNFSQTAVGTPFNPANTNAPNGGSSFKIIDVVPKDTVDAFFKVLLGEVAGAHIRGLIAENYCDELNERFEASPFRKPRNDGVPGDEWGATQFGKSPSELATIAYEQQGNYRSLIGGPENPIANFFRNVAIAGSKLSLTVRPAIYQGQPMVTMRAVRWTKGSGKPRWLLGLHDDWAQTVSSRNEGFEIQNVVRLVAFNFYIKSKPGSGQLVAYDWKPTNADRERIGVVDTGYPYADTDIPAGVKEHVFEQSAGDLVLLDGAYLHGVLVGKDELPGRLIVNGFAALLADGVVALFA